jgi:hypothetical protein
MTRLDDKQKGKRRGKRREEIKKEKARGRGEPLPYKEWLAT